MKKLTLEECKKLHHKMWTLLAEGVIKEKEDFAFPDIGKDWDAYGYCFMCYWSFINSLEGDVCVDCPGEWPQIYNVDGVTPCHNSYFGMWLDARDEGKWEKARAIAKQIAELPWKEK